MEISMNKCNRILTFLLMTCSIVVPAQASDVDENNFAQSKIKITFQVSQEEDFEEVSRYEYQLKKDKTAAEVNEYLLSLKLFSVINKDQIKALPHLVNLMKRYGGGTASVGFKLWSGVIDSFQLLKDRMDIPDEVEVKFFECDPRSEYAHWVGGYNCLDRTVYLTPKFIDRPFSSQLFTLIHELTHALQHTRLGIIKAWYEMSSFDKEHEADNCASKIITCSVCMHEIEDDYPCDQGSDYLSLADIVSCRKNKDVKNLCDAHRVDSVENKRLRSLLLIPVEKLTSEEANERGILKYEIGSLKERLSTLDFTPCDSVARS